MHKCHSGLALIFTVFLYLLSQSFGHFTPEINQMKTYTKHSLGAQERYMKSILLMQQCVILHVKICNYHYTLIFRIIATVSL